MFKVNNKNTETTWHRSGVFNVNIVHILHLFCFSYYFEQVNVSWESFGSYVFIDGWSLVVLSLQEWSESPSTWVSNN